MSDSSSSTETTPTSSLVVYWNVGAALTVGLPIFLFLLAQFFAVPGNGGQGGGGGQGGWGWGEGQGNRWMDGPEEERWQGLGHVVVYLWSLVIFGVLASRGKRVLTHNRDIRALFVGLVVFANLAFLCWILVATAGPRRGNEEAGGMGTLASVETITFFLMLLFSGGFAMALHSKAQVNEAPPPSQSPAESMYYSVFYPERSEKKPEESGIM